jgi:hypothetical protein
MSYGAASPPLAVKKSLMSVASRSPSESGPIPSSSSLVFSTLTVERCRVPA